MREITLKIDFVKSKVRDLIGEPMNFVVNRGRNRIENYSGCVQDAYPAIFTVKTTSNSGEEQLQTFSYNDILNHSIKFVKA